jgi:hypothetical protein
MCFLQDECNILSDPKEVGGDQQVVAKRGEIILHP